MSKPKFNPEKPFTAVDEVGTKQAGPKPKFDKNKPFYEYIGDSLMAQEEFEKEQIDKAPDMALLMAQGAAHDFLDEGAGAVTAMTGGEYKEGRNKMRARIDEARKATGLGGDAAEIIGNVGVTMIPGARVASKVGTELGLAALQGAGAADELEDVPGQAAKSAAVSGATQIVGKGINKLLFNEPDKILARTTGANRKNFWDAKNTPKAPEQIRKRLDDMGFFKQGEVVYDKTTNKWIPHPSKSRLETFFKPQSLDDLHNRAQEAITALRHENDQLLKNKKIPMSKVLAATQQAARDFIPDGFDYVKREEAANKIVDKILMDLELKGKVPKNGLIDALDVEDIKRQMQNEVFNTFHKSADDLALTPESIRTFSTKIDDLVDSYGGPTYKKNNDLMSDLITQNEQIFQKVARESAEGIEKPNLTRGSITDRLVDMINPAPVGVMRARIGKSVDTIPGEITRKAFKRAPVEILNNHMQPPVEVIEDDPSHPMNQQGKGRMPQSVPNIPEQFIRTPLPRTTEGLMKNKTFVLGKVAQMMPEMFEAVKDTYDHEPEMLGEIAQVLSLKMPHLFERDKYNRFDGRILSEKDKQAAIKDTLLKNELSSIEQAKIITRLNKEGLYDG